MHRSYYNVRARKHDAAARSAKSASDKEGHREIARGYRRLAHKSSGGHTFSAMGHHVKVKSHGRGRHRDSKGRFKR